MVDKENLNCKDGEKNLEDNVPIDEKDNYHGDEKKDVDKNKEVKKEEKKSLEDIDYKEKFKEYENRFLRLQADFDNYKKRIEREREGVYTYALEDMMLQLLPIIDNFDRALDSFENGNVDKEYIEGLKMVYNSFIETLNKNGLAEIEAIGCEFDPCFHHAVMKEEAEEDDENLVKEVFQKGYTFNTKVIRPCMVKVAIKN